MRLRIIIESPYAGDVQRHETYARACMLDSLRLGEAPLAFHLLYTQVLNDLRANERMLGIKASQWWYSSAEMVAVYTDLGISAGMRQGIEFSTSLGVPVVYRQLGSLWEAPRG